MPAVHPSSVLTSSEKVANVAGLSSLQVSRCLPNQGLCRRRGWHDPSYECYRDGSGFTCLVLVNGREYQTDIPYESHGLAQENAAMRAFMVCRNFSVNGGMLARNGIVQGLPADEAKHKSRRSSRPHTSSQYTHGHRNRHSGDESSNSSTTSME